MKCLECNKEMKYLRSDHFASKCVNGSVSSLVEYKAKHPGSITIDPDIAASRAQTLENMIRRHGEVIGAQKWESYCQKHRTKMSIGGFISKGKSEADFKDFNKSRAQTLENMIRRHGEVIGAQKWESYCQKQKIAGCSLEYFTEKYGPHIGHEIYLDVNKKKGITLENMIRVHGLDEGPLRYGLWQQRTAGNFISKNASNFVKELIQRLPYTFIFHEGIFGKEFCVYDTRPYMFDFVITSPCRLAIEYNGDFWHANPLMYDAGQEIPLRGGNRLAKDIWDKDATKLKAIEARGFKTYVIWDSEYLSEPEKTLNKVLQWILQNTE